jgi:hypothetical protein
MAKVISVHEYELSELWRRARKLAGFTARFTGFLPGVGKRPMPMT